MACRSFITMRNERRAWPGGGGRSSYVKFRTSCEVWFGQRWFEGGGGVKGRRLLFVAKKAEEVHQPAVGEHRLWQ